MPTFSCSIELVELRRLLNIDESKLLVGLNNLKLITPIIPEIMAVVAKTIIVITRILPSFFELSILAIEEEMLKKTIGTSNVKIKFKNKFPIDSNTIAFSPNSIPKKPPISMAISNISEEA